MKKTLKPIERELLLKDAPKILWPTKFMLFILELKIGHKSYVIVFYLKVLMMLKIITFWACYRNSFGLEYSGLRYFTKNKARFYVFLSKNKYSE